MLASSAKTLVKDLLQLFSRASGVAVQLYEVGPNGETVASITHEEAVPEHCRAIWKLDQGRGRKACVDDMCKRATTTLKAAVRDDCLCHAGLDTARYPLLRAGETVAVLQYGGLAINENDAKRVQRLERHRSAMIDLNASSEEATNIEALLHQIESDKPPTYWVETHNSLPAIIERIISRHLTEAERQRRVEREVYHDLLLRLTAAVHAADTLSDGYPDDSNVRNKAERVVAALSFARQVAHNLWRGQYLPDKYDFKPVSLRELIDEAISLCAPEAESKGLEFEVLLTGDPQVTVSKLHLQVALNNIMHNAVKYSYRTTVTSNPRYVSIRGTQNSTGYELAITNYGIGVEPDEHQRVFESGYKGRQTLAEYRSGAGQGLPLAKAVIDRHDGRISLTSTSTSGSSQSNRQTEKSAPYKTRCSIWLPSRYSAR